jgi:hypothetical protein
MLFTGKQVEITDEQKTKLQQEKADKNKNKKPVSEAKDRAYKDKNKARFGNHNRKSMRDKKVAKSAPAPST